MPRHEGCSTRGLLDSRSAGYVRPPHLSSSLANAESACGDWLRICTTSSRSREGLDCVLIKPNYKRKLKHAKTDYSVYIAMYLNTLKIVAPEPRRARLSGEPIFSELSLLVNDCTVQDNNSTTPVNLPLL